MKEKWIRSGMFAVFLLCLGLGVFLPDNSVSQILLTVILCGSLILIDYFAPVLANLSSGNPKIKTMRRVLRGSLIIMLAVFIGSWFFPQQISQLANQDGLIQTLLVAGAMVVFGNVAPKLPCNGYVGIRLPWTVSSEKAWRACHRLLGYLSFFIALLLILGKLFFPLPYWMPVCLICWLTVPSVYSLCVYYQEKREEIGKPVKQLSRFFCFFPSVLSVMINAVFYFYLPPTLVMQIKQDGRPGNIIPTLAGLLLMSGIVLLFNLISFFSVQKARGYFFLSFFLLTFNIFVIFWNLAII